MRRFRKATIKDVAQHAGVSTTTVSYFVSGRESVCSPDTARRIREAIETLHYTPSSLTGGLRQQPTTTIGLCIYHPFDTEVLFGNPYFARMLRGVMYQADVEKYALLHYPYHIRSAIQSDVFLDGRVDGLLFDPTHDHHAPRMVKAGMPTVIVGRFRSLPANAGCSYANDKMTVDLALSHLWALGHRRIAHVAGPVGLGRSETILLTDDAADVRLEEFSAWTQQRSAFDPALIAYAGSWQAIADPQILSYWRGLKDPPTAVFCANDALAIDLMEKATSVGWRVPQDLSVVGVDNFGSATACTPALTTIDVPIEQVGREAVRALIGLIHGVSLEQCRVCVPVTELVVRGSTAPIAPRSTGL